MPSLPLRPCGQSGCPALVARGRCPEHQQPARPVVPPVRLYDDRRGSSTQRGYGYAWQQRRKAGLLREPTCRMCGKAATDRDHKIPKSQGGSDDDSNTWSLCKTCHARKTAREKR